MTAALRNALDLFLMPSRIRQVQREPLPEGVCELLQIAAGDQSILRAAAERSDRDPSVVRNAAIFFIEQVQLAKDSDSYRILGADQDATMHELRRNAALLLKWLHPDAQAADARAALAARVTAAWNDLKTPERRAAYDNRVARTEASPSPLSRKATKARRLSHAGEGTRPLAKGGRLSGDKPRRTLLRQILFALAGWSPPRG